MLVLPYFPDKKFFVRKSVTTYAFPELSFVINIKRKILNNNFDFFVLKQQKRKTILTFKISLKIYLADICSSTSTSNLPFFQRQPINDKNSRKYSTIIGCRRKKGKIDPEVEQQIYKLVKFLLGEFPIPQSLVIGGLYSNSSGQEFASQPFASLKIIIGLSLRSR